MKQSNDESAHFVQNFKPTPCELEILARHYLEILKEEEFWARFLGGADPEWFASRRLRTIGDVLGEERFKKAIATTLEKWDKEFVEAEQIEKNLGPCKTCGRHRDYEDYAWSIPDACCGECKSLVETALGKDRFQKAIASAGEDWHRTFAEAKEFEEKLGPCKTCGRKLDIYNYRISTIPYCLPCYLEWETEQE